MNNIVSEIIVVKNGDAALPCGNDNLAIRVLNRRNKRNSVVLPDGKYILTSVLTQDGFSDLLLEDFPVVAPSNK